MSKCYTLISFSVFQVDTHQNVTPQKFCLYCLSLALATCPADHNILLTRGDLRKSLSCSLFLFVLMHQSGWLFWRFWRIFQVTLVSLLRIQVKTCVVTPPHTFKRVPAVSIREGAYGSILRTSCCSLTSSFLGLHFFLNTLLKNISNLCFSLKRSKAWTVFARLNTGIVGSNPTRGMDVCVHLFCVCIVLCVGSGLATGWSPVQGVLPTVYRIKKLKKQARYNKRAVEPEIDRQIF
jgi:hypothetical protein